MVFGACGSVLRFGLKGSICTGGTLNSGPSQSNSDSMEEVLSSAVTGGIEKIDAVDILGRGVR